MDPASIAAISIGVSAVLASAGSCLVPLCRKQKKSLDESSTNDNSDVVVASYKGTSHSEISCFCCKIVKDKEPNIQFNSQETDKAANAINATNQSGSAEQFTSKQPRLSVSSALASAAASVVPTGTIGGADSEITSSDPEIAAPTLTNEPLIFNNHNNSDGRNNFMVKNLQIKSDGSCSADEINLNVGRPLAFSPSNTHMGRYVAETIIVPMRDLLAHFAQLKVAAITHNAAYVPGASTDHSNEHILVTMRDLLAHFAQHKFTPVAHNTAYVDSDHSNEHISAVERSLAGLSINSDHDVA